MNSSTFEEEENQRERCVFFGFVGGIVSNSHNEQERGQIIGIGEEAAQICGLHEGQVVSVQLEYSYSKLDQIELEPLTVDDFEIIEQNCDQIEE